jgi:hypothetical protein
VISALFLAQLANASDAQDDAAFQIADVKVTEVVPTAAEIYSTMLQQPKPSARPNLQTFDFSSLDWNQMVFIGQKIVELIKAGVPVVNVKRDAISVVPAGVESWEQLSGWQIPVTKVYEVKATNGWGVDVVSMRLKVSAMYGGGVDGRGQYLANVVIVPAEVTVQWGFSVDVWSENRQPVNMGTLASPMAGLGFDIRYKVQSILTQKNGTQDYFISGNGNIVEMQ